MKNKKTYAKAYGLKSTFYDGNDVYASKFGDKNESIVVKQIYRNDEIKNIKDADFDVSSSNHKLAVSLKDKSKTVTINNPIDNPKTDILGFKTKIEEEFFGKTYNDNVHIQIGYNIMDINKILTRYIYNCVYSINSLCRNREYNESKDIIGTLKYNIPYNEYDPTKNNGFKTFVDNSYGYLCYYPIFKKSTEKENNDEYNYNILRTISYFRNSIAHSDRDNKNNIYKIESSLPNDLKIMINNFFDKHLEGINKDFAKNATVNIQIISSISEKRISPELVKDYYDFSIFKSNKNIGVNIKHFREKVYEYLANNYYIDIYSHNNDSFRKKINMTYDYIINDYLLSINEEIVNKLRRALDEEEKEKVYDEYIKKFVNININKLIVNGEDRISKEIKKFVIAKEKDKYISGNDKSNFNIYFDKKNNKQVSLKKLPEEQLLKTSNFSIFSKSIYFISNILNRKDQNNLITSLINKFDNIGVFNQLIIKDLCKATDYKDEYSMFDSATKISNELRIIKNLSGMKAELSNPSKDVLIDALKSLGIRECDLDSEFNKMMNQEKEKHQFRNFLINNVIKSTRFEYIVKYMDPSYAKNIIHSEKLVKSVLYGIPHLQLLRYYNVFVKGKEQSKDVIVNFLTKELNKFNYYSLNQKQIILANAKIDKLNYTQIDNQRLAKIELENVKALVNLYYTVIYLVIKNLVNINTVFSLAFECFERDNSIAGFNDKICYNKKQLSLFEKTKEFYSKYADAKNGRGAKKHTFEWMTQNYELYNEYYSNSFKNIRNSVLHMNVITNSYKYLNSIDLHFKDFVDENKQIPVYYELYIFILQKMYLENNPDLKFSESLDKYKSYNKDMLKIMLLPLAYNVERYKSLTIRDLFYDKIITE